MSIDENRRRSYGRLERQWRSLVRHRHDLALGIERIGLVSLRFPVIVGTLATALAILAGVGVARIKIDGDQRRAGGNHHEGHSGSPTRYRIADRRLPRQASSTLD